MDFENSDYFVVDISVSVRLQAQIDTFMSKPYANRVFRRKLVTNHRKVYRVVGPGREFR
jgi:hypothetical protein